MGARPGPHERRSPPMNPPELTDPAALAVQRLSASRLALRAQLVPPPRTGAPEGGWRGKGSTHAPPAGRLALGAHAPARLARRPVGAGPGAERLAAQPLASGRCRAGGAGAGTRGALGAPPSRGRAVLLATGAGAALVATRSWMGPLVHTQLRHLPRRAGAWAAREFSQGPWPSLLTGLLLAAVATTHPPPPGEADVPRP